MPTVSCPEARITTRYSPGSAKLPCGPRPPRPKPPKPRPPPAGCTSPWADGSCLYHLTSAVDDHDFAITHVIRAVEHLSNTPRQIFIAQALGYDLPAYAHLPYVAAPGGQEKLSKRKLAQYLKHHEFKKIYDHGVEVMARRGVETSPETFNPVVVDFYRDVGYRPEALVNYLLLLGWSLDDKTETFTREEMVRHFSLDRVKASAASFDPPKLLAFEERAMSALSLEAKVDVVWPYLREAGLVAEPPTEGERERATAVTAAAGDRIRVAGDILAYPEFFTADADVVYDPKAFTKRLCGAGAAERLTRFREVLTTVEPFDAEPLEAALHRFADAAELSVGQVVHPVRVAVTGKGIGFGLFEALAILGRESCLARIDRALRLVAEAAAADGASE